MKKILVTGGAGYIGSVAVKKLIEQGHNVIVIDNLSKGIKELVHKDATFYEADLIDKHKVYSIFDKEKPEVVMHFASYKAAGESMKHTEKYSDNRTGLSHLLDAMHTYNCKNIIYSSSAAVYGEPEYTPIDEKHQTKPINYYGYTKLVGEELLEWHAKVNNLHYVSLRYFNVIGDGGLNYIDPDAQNIVPLVMEAVARTRENITIFGDDYDTRDGTCIRDYIDVNDLIDAHIMALNTQENVIVNLGTSHGTSVKELIAAAKKVTGTDFTVDIGHRRDGDPATLTASNDKAKSILSWTPKKTFEESIEDTYNAYMSKKKE